MKTIHYINLTNGIEWVTHIMVEYHNADIRFIRLQSTHCEQKLWDDVIANIDADFLMNLALGNKCIVYDDSAHSDTSRAVWQGMLFLRMAINKRWFDSTGIINDSQHRYLSGVINNLSKPSKNKLDYFKKFINCDKIELDTVCANTHHDGDIGFFRKILHGL